ncbi:MAG TPA: hypothetical protein VFT96_03030 [Gemmatimonadaceae bacterium]|nr:hypothetical protein [Gemmatimonadaceae bacterium]
MHPRTGLAIFITSAVLIAVAYGAAFLPGGAPRWAPFLLAGGTAGTMTGAMALGASRPGRRLGSLAFVFGAAFLIIAGGFAAALLLPAEVPTSQLWLGLPARAAILIYGIGLLPVVLLPFAYAATFDRVTLSEQDLAEFRARSAAARGAGPAPADEGEPGRPA